MPSRVIHGMLYSPQERTLNVVLRGGRGTYRYFDVSGEEWQAFKRAPSKGTYFNAVFKAHHRRFTRLDSIPEPSVVTLAASASTPLRDLPDGNVWGFYENSL